MYIGSYVGPKNVGAIIFYTKRDGNFVIYITYRRSVDVFSSSAYLLPGATEHRGRSFSRYRYYSGRYHFPIAERRWSVFLELRRRRRRRALRAPSVSGDGGALSKRRTTGGGRSSACRRLRPLQHSRRVVSARRTPLLRMYVEPGEYTCAFVRRVVYVTVFPYNLLSPEYIRI